MLPQIPERDATPEIAAIYSEIKTVSGLPMVNLVWRHFAVFPGVLRWAWETVSPVVGSAAMDVARQQIVASLALPPLAPIGADGMRAAHLTTQDQARIGAVVDAYIRGNLVNIVALTALRMRLEHPDRPAARLTVSTRPASTPRQIDPLPRVDGLDPRLVAQIHALTKYHEGANADVIPSFYLALTYWPGLIEALPIWLSSLYEPSAMRAARLEVCDLAEAHAEAMLPKSSPPPDGISAVEPALDRFTRVLLPGAIPVCVALRRVLFDG
jgi:hypothetical protein